MSRSKKSNRRKAATPVISDNGLPQNIRLVGEKDIEEKRTVYIQQSVYGEIHRFALRLTSVESGGILVGNVIEQFGKNYVIIKGFVQASFSEATPTTLKFTHETWEQCYREMERKFPNQKILGWIHTHPNYGIFLSENDKFIHSNFFRDENNVAYVIDPLQNIEGFYIWHNGQIERCKGFYVFDRNDVEIDLCDEAKEPVKSSKRIIIPILFTITGILAIACVVLFMQTSNLKVQVENLQESQQRLVDSANQGFVGMQTLIANQEQTIDTLNSQLASLQSEITKMQSNLDALQASEDTSDRAGSEPPLPSATSSNSATDSSTIGNPSSTNPIDDGRGAGQE